MRLTGATRWIALTIVGITAASAPALPPPEETSLLVQGFRIEIEELPNGQDTDEGQACRSDRFSCSLSPHVTKVEISDLVFPIIESWDGRSPAMTYRHSPPEPVRVSMTVRKSSGQNPALEWWTRATSGRRDVRTITVSVLDQAMEAARTYTFHDCTPVSYSTGPLASAGTVLTETLVVEAQRTEVSAFGSSDRWTSLSGGTKEMGILEGSRSGTPCIQTKPIRIACNVSTPNTGLTQWITATLQGQSQERTVTQTLIDVQGQDFMVNQHPACFVHRLVFPKLDVTTDAPATEAIELQVSGAPASSG